MKLQGSINAKEFGLLLRMIISRLYDITKEEDLLTEVTKYDKSIIDSILKGFRISTSMDIEIEWFEFIIGF